MGNAWYAATMLELYKVMRESALRHLLGRSKNDDDDDDSGPGPSAFAVQTPDWFGISRGPSCPAGDVPAA